MPSPGAISAEELTVDYGQLGSDVHRAVGRILTSHADESFRVDEIEPHQLEGIRGILRVAEGSRLPDYHYDEDGNYVQMGTTPVVEERHTRVFAPDHLSQGGSSRELWLKVPRFSIGQEVERDEAPASNRDFTKKEIAAAATGGVLVNGLLITGLETGKPGFIAASLLTDASMLTYFIGYRMNQVLGPLRLRS